jgi:hypothetical protein
MQLLKISKSQSLILKLKYNAVGQTNWWINIQMRSRINMIKNYKILMLFSQQAAKK